MATSAESLSLTTPVSFHTFLGNVTEVCIVTPDYHKTISSLSHMGIGPWRIYTFSPSNVSAQTYHGAPSTFNLRVCFASLTPTIAYEVIEPLPDSGPNIFTEWLESHNGEPGVHHIAYDCNDMPWEERRKGFEERGAKFVQGGVWAGGCRFAWFEVGGEVEGESSTGTFFETIQWSDDWVDPAPDAWFPAKTERVGE